VAVQIELRGLRGPPIRTDLREFSHDQAFDVWACRLFIVEVGANIPYVWIGQTNNLAGVTWVGKDFLVSGEARIENDFAAPARNRASRAATK
jgi:hypothetical protein